jgi:beta-lysine 5,6-aminomutase beta subunit
MTETPRHPHRIKPYGDHWDDGKMQLSFTLPTQAGERAKEAARLYLEKLGFEKIVITNMEPMGEEFSFFVAYGCAAPHIDLTKITLHKPEFPILSKEELEELVHDRIRRRIVLLGATTGSDAHTVGLDAILSIKGIAGEKGLEYYPFFRVINLRAQVSNEALIEKARELKADAILISKFVTQQDQHLEDLKKLNHMIRNERQFVPHLVKIVGGPRMDHRIARSIGFDAGFGPGTKPSEVANYIVHELIRRLSHETSHRMEGEAPPPTHKKRRSLFGWLSGGGKDS